MARLIGFRLAAAVPQLLLVSILLFLITYLMPGSPAAVILGERATPEAIAEIEARLGLDQPAPERLIDWLGGAVQGDLGVSLAGGRPVSELIWERLPVTLSLTLGGMTVAFSAGVLGGILAALKPSSLLDRSLTIGTSIGLAVPEFWFGLVLILIFSVELGWFPVISYTPLTEDPLAWVHGLILPSITLASVGAAMIGRQTRNAMLGALEAPYVDTLRAVGVRSRRITLRYALKNAMVPVLAISGWQLTTLIATSFIVERVFAMDGVGHLLIDAVLTQDIPVVQGAILVTASAVVVIYLLVDIAYGYFDPRARPQ
jgi:peptide/nickel transport system permease protein